MPFSFLPLLHWGQMSSWDRKKEECWSHEEYLCLLTWSTLLSSNRSLFGGGHCLRKLLCASCLGPWLYAGSQVPTVWYIRYPRLPMELFPSLHKVWSPGSTQVLSCSHFALSFCNVFNVICVWQQLHYLCIGALSMSHHKSHELENCLGLMPGDSWDKERVRFESAFFGLGLWC